MTADDLTRVAIAVVAFLIGLAAGAGWLAERDGKAVHWPVRIVHAIAGGMRFYMSLILLGAVLYVGYLIVMDVLHPAPAPPAAHTGSAAPDAPAPPG
jgi:hypothetical protein